MGEISHWTLPILFRFKINSRLPFYMMFRWRASLWKTVWRELLIYLLFYLAISLIYRFWSTILSEDSLIFPIKGLS